MKKFAGLSLMVFLLILSQLSCTIRNIYEERKIVEKLFSNENRKGWILTD